MDLRSRPWGDSSPRGFLRGSDRTATGWTTWRWKCCAGRIKIACIPVVDCVFLRTDRPIPANLTESWNRWKARQLTSGSGCLHCRTGLASRPSVKQPDPEVFLLEKTEKIKLIAQMAASIHAGRLAMQNNPLPPKAKLAASFHDAVHLFVMVEESVK